MEWKARRMELQEKYLNLRQAMDVRKKNRVYGEGHW